MGNTLNYNIYSHIKVTLISSFTWERLSIHENFNKIERIVENLFCSFVVNAPWRKKISGSKCQFDVSLCPCVLVLFAGKTSMKHTLRDGRM